MANFTSQEELERKLSRRRVVELFDQDGDGALNGEEQTTLDEAVATANDEATGIILRKGFSSDQLNTLSQDASLRRAATGMLAQIAGENRTEFLDGEGKGPYDNVGERGRKEFEKYSRGEKRSRKEDEAGDNPIVGGDTDIGSPVFIFSRAPGRSQGPGGF